MAKNNTGLMIGGIVGIVLAFVALIAITQLQNKADIDYEAYDLNSVIAADENTGGLAENVDGDPDAPVLLYEYGDYQCTACAPMNPHINELLEEYDGKVAVVFRTYIMSYHDNGVAAASAANAAAIQGYWKEYKDLLYETQNDWYYAEGDERQQMFEQYFEQVTDGKGDLEQFRQDMGSKEVAQKIKFDAALSERVGLEWTPSFYLDGELLDQRNITTSEFMDLLREKIDAKLAELGEE